MKVILLAAGYGRRLNPITNKTPKCLVKINDKPLLEHWLEFLHKNKISSILINTHYLSHIVEKYIYSSAFKELITLSYEEKLLGTAGTLIANENFIGNETIFLAHADNLTNFDLESFLRKHNKRPKECLITMMLFRTDNPSNCGIVEIDEREVVVNFFEKYNNPSSNLANAGVYLIEPKLIEIIKNFDKNSDFCIDIIPHFLGKIYTFLNTKYHRDIGSHESLKIARLEYKNYFKK